MAPERIQGPYFVPNGAGDGRDSRDTTLGVLSSGTDRPLGVGANSGWLLLMY